MKRQTPYDSFMDGFIKSSKGVISASAFVSAAVYALLAASILAAMYYLEVSEEFWTPILLVYGVGAVAHMAAEAF